METRITSSSSSSSSSIPPPPPPPPAPPAGGFTTTEIAAAEQLVQLSESTGETPDASASSSSPRSVSTRGNFAPPTPEAAEDDEDEDEDEVGGLRRRNKRYRPIRDVYASTAPIKSKKGFPEKSQQKTKKKGG